MSKRRQRRVASVGLLLLLLLAGCATQTPQGAWPHLGWEENLPSLQPRVEEHAAPVFKDWPPQP